MLVQQLRCYKSYPLNRNLVLEIYKKKGCNQFGLKFSFSFGLGIKSFVSSFFILASSWFGKYGYICLAIYYVRWGMIMASIGCGKEEYKKRLHPELWILIPLMIQLDLWRLELMLILFLTWLVFFDISSWSCHPS